MDNGLRLIERRLTAVSATVTIRIRPQQSEHRDERGHIAATVMTTQFKLPQVALASQAAYNITECCLGLGWTDGRDQQRLNGLD
jgi:hypothetical protein